MRLFGVAVCALTLVAGVPSAGRQAAPSIGDLLTQYERGAYDDAAHAMGDVSLSHDSLDSVFLDLRGLAPQWIGAGGPGAEARRRLVIASFAVELARARTTVEWRQRYPLVVWACELLRRDPTHLAAERWWYLASLASIEEAGDWVHTLGTARRATAATSFFSAADAAEYRDGHVTHAKAAFPDEPRWLLAQVQYDESQTFLSGLAEPPALITQDVSPTFVAGLARVVAGQKVEAPFDAIAPDVAREMLDKIARIPDVARDYAALARYEDLRGDVELHLGFLRLRAADWAGALDHLGQVPNATAEPFLIGLSHYFSGWVFQRTGRRDDAITEYRQALALAPRARSASVLLAAQLAETGKQAEGYEVLDAAIRASPAPDLLIPPAQRTRDAAADPWLLYRRGDAGLAPTFLARLREALR